MGGPAGPYFDTLYLIELKRYRGILSFYTVGQSAPSADSQARKQAVTSEFHLLSRLRHDGLQIPEDLVNEPELGIGLAFPNPRATPAGSVAGRAQDSLALEDQLKLITDIAGSSTTPTATGWCTAA